MALLTTDWAVRAGRHLEAEIMRREARREEAPAAVAALAVGAETERGVIDGAQLGAVVVGAVASHARQRRELERSVAAVPVAFLAGDGRVPTDQGKAGAAMSVGLKQNRAPALFLMTARAVLAELARVGIAVAAGAAVGDGRPEVLVMATSTGEGGVSTEEREPGALVIESDL
jgi:hypothetical protein